MIDFSVVRGNINLINVITPPHGKKACTLNDAWLPSGASGVVKQHCMVIHTLFNNHSGVSPAVTAPMHSSVTPAGTSPMHFGVVWFN